MSGKLFVVGTPIGNLGDFSPRAVSTLQEVDFIAAEDTRVTRKLLSKFEIHTPMISYYEHNLRERGAQIVARILAGENAALVSDAGMPCVSDPGEDLVRQCVRHSISVLAIPGPSAAMMALCVSGLPTSRFVFEGFLTTNHRGRMTRLCELSTLKQTLIFYEAPHKLVSTLADLHEALGDRNIAIVKELTKLHEQADRTTLAHAAEKYANGPSPKGEYVLVVEGASGLDAPSMTLEETVDLARDLQQQGLKPAEAARRAAEMGGFKKAEVYKNLVRPGSSGGTDI